jgi:hypothetical protein
MGTAYIPVGSNQVDYPGLCESGTTYQARVQPSLDSMIRLPSEIHSQTSRFSSQAIPTSQVFSHGFKIWLAIISSLKSIKTTISRDITI